MKERIPRLAALLALALVALPLFAQPVVSEKKDVAIFALNNTGWPIPLEAMGGIDMEIQKVFDELKRFRIIGMTQRMSAKGLEQFIETLKKAKEADFVMPPQFQFQEAVFTEADFKKLVGSFIVAAPIVSQFNSSYNSKSSQWETEIMTNVTFIDVAAGAVMEIVDVTTSGSDKENQLKSITSAINGIPGQLEFEIRSVPAFQINTRVLAMSGSEVKLQLGRNMGIQKGDAYSVILSERIEGFENERETGLILIKDVGPEISTGLVLYGKNTIGKDSQIREIPRMGVDASPYVHLLLGFQGEDFMLVPGARFSVSRGFFGFRPGFALQLPLGIASEYSNVIPVSVLGGGELNLHMGRLTLSPFAGAGVTYAHVSDVDAEDTEIFPHVGAQAYLEISFLFSRDMAFFAHGGAEYWLAINSDFDSFGGLGFGGGVAFKL